MKVYRCGYCGRPTDEDGDSIDFDMDTAEEVYGDCENLTHGSCCVQQEPEREMVQVTRDMASDAQDMSLEGQWIEW